MLTAIVPATNRPATLARCLAAIEHADAAPEQVIVVEDPSLRHPALARNVGAREAKGDILVFIDADVTVHADAFTRMRQAFDETPQLVALFGSYDDEPESPGLVSVFRNLLHHHVHQHEAGPASTFWAGLGAMRRDTFEAAGGFVVHPIEDIELGMRLAATGAAIRLDPLIQGTHLKHWSLWSMLRTDLLVRGIPWVGLLIEHRNHKQAQVLNLGWRARLTALTCLAILAAAALRSIWLVVAAIILLVALNRSFYHLLVRKEGVLRAAGGVVLHFLHNLVAIASVPLGILTYHVRQRRAPARMG